MTIKDKKMLYESIMKDLAGTVIKAINEAYGSSLVKDFIRNIKDTLKKHGDPSSYKPFGRVVLAFNGRLVELLTVYQDGELKRTFRNGERTPLPLSDISDDNIYGQKIITDFKKLNRKFTNIDALVFWSANTRKSAIVLTGNTGDLYSGLFLTEEGTAQVAGMLRKTIERKDESGKAQKQTPGQLKISEQREMFAWVEKALKKYREVYGHELADLMQETVNKIAKNQSFIDAAKKNAGDLDLTERQKYLYGYFLNRKDTFGFLDWMDKGKLAEIKQKFWKDRK